MRLYGFEENENILWVDSQMIFCEDAYDKHSDIYQMFVENTCIVNLKRELKCL